MLNRTMSFTAALLLGGCASQPTPPPAAEEPAPVEITESAPPAAPAAESQVADGIRGNQTADASQAAYGAQAHEASADADASEDARAAQAAASQKPAQTEDGRFRISIASLDSAELTARWVQKAEAAGYRTEIWQVTIDGKTWHRVLLPGYASLADAQAALPIVQQELDAPGAWVTSRRRAPAPEDTSAAPPPPAPEMPAPAN